MKPAKQKTRPAFPVTEARVVASQAGISWWKWLIAAFGALLLVLEVYWPAVNGPFVFDDIYLPFQSEPDFANWGVAQMIRSQRPLLMASYWFNQRFFGPEASSFHVLNILLHFCSGLLIWALLRRMLGWVDVTDWKRETLSCFAAIVFLVHPVQNESVAYIAGRSETLSVLFFLAAFTLFVYRKNEAITFAEAGGVLALFAASVVTKEHTVVLPVVLVLTDLLWGSGTPVERVKKNWRLYLPMAVLSMAGLAMIWRLLMGADTAGLKIQGLTWSDYFFTQWRAWWVYIRLFVAPYDLNADYDFAISRSPFDHLAIVGLIAMLAALGIAWKYRKSFPLAFYGLLVFLLLLAPTSSIVPIKDALAERRLYLPFIGLLLIACDFLRRLKWKKMQLNGALVGVVVILSMASSSRAAVWSDNTALWEDTVKKSPHNGRAHFQLALAYFQANRCVESEKEYAEAARIGPLEHRLLLDWALAYDCSGRPEDALAKLNQAVALKDDGLTNSHIGLIYAKQKKWDQALEWLDKAEKREPGYDMTYLYRGGVYAGLGNYERAVAEYKRALALAPDNAVAQQALAQAIQQLPRGK